MSQRNLPREPRIVAPTEHGRKSAPRIGIMGGTFNPIHYGHLVAAEQARGALKLDHVVFVPSGEPPHKIHRGIAPAEHRYLMTVLATSTNPHFSVSRTEIDREGPSYAIDTIRHFLRRKPRPSVYFITGCDAVMEILTWRDAAAVMRLCTVVAASRPGHDLHELKEAVGPSNWKRVRPLEVSALAISSTDIRNRVRDDQPIKYLVPDAVEQHIHKNGLYA